MKNNIDGEISWVNHSDLTSFFRTLELKKMPFLPGDMNEQCSKPLLIDSNILVGGLEHGFYDFPYICILGTIILTFIFFRGVETTNQYI